MDEIGFPEGVVNMVHGSKDVVNGILDHPDIKGVSFVGVLTRSHISTSAAVKPASGFRPWVVPKTWWPSCPMPIIDDGMPSLITSFFGCAGQRCLSGSLLVPVGDIADELKEKFVAAARRSKSAAVWMN